MLQKVGKTIEHYQLLQPGDRVVVAVSGGIDSVVLLHVLITLRENYCLELLVAHLDHGLRGQEAKEDSLFVAGLAKSYGLVSMLEETSVPRLMKNSGQSPQEAARMVRYNFLEKARASFRGNVIAIGQHANDQAETVLINLLRGGAGTGLKGIPVKRGYLIRPLLEVSREEIEAYAGKHELSFRSDSSNLKKIYLRNKIRLELLPALEQEYNPNIVATLGKTATVLADENKLLNQMAAQVLDRGIVSVNGQVYVLDLARLDREDVALKRRAVRLVYGKTIGEPLNPNLGFGHVEQVLQLMKQGTTGTRLNLPGKIVIRKEYNRLYVGPEEILRSREETVEFLPAEATELLVPGKTTLPSLSLTLTTDLLSNVLPKVLADSSRDPNEIWLDWDCLVGKNLYIRGRKPGDRFQPRGMHGASKKLKDFFIDAKVPRWQRSQIPLLVTGEDEIIWIVGWRVGENYGANESAGQILKVKASWETQE